MTTATRDTSAAARRASAAVLGGASLAMLAAGGLVVVLGAVLGGGDAALGALIATVLVSTVLASGAMVVEMTARAMPGASMMVALLTYTLQVVFLLAVLVLLRSSPDAMASIDTRWFAAAVIGCALVWTVGQVVLTMRTRIPVYDLPERLGTTSGADLAEVSER